MKIIFAGTPAFAVPSLRLLLNSEHEVCAVYTQPDRPAGRGRQIQISPVKEVALNAHIPVLQPTSFANPSDFQQLEAFQPDLIVVVAYGMILPQSVLDLPKYGCINVHGSLLPRWRGAAPIQRAIMAGDAETGVTIMQIVRKLDAGAMLHKERYTITPTDTSSDVHDQLAELGAIGLAKVLPLIESGQLIAEPQDENLVTYAEKLDKHEADIDWTQPADIIVRKIRGLNPWPVAQTRYDNNILRIWLAEHSDANLTLAPGQVSCAHKSLLVGTGAGLVKLSEVQLPGGKRLPSHAFLAAHHIDGVTFG